MTIARKIHSNNIVAGAGEIRFAKIIVGEDGEETYDGEIYVGDSVSLSMSISQETRQTQSGDGATPTVLESTVTSTDRSFAFVLHDISAPNMALFLQGTAGEQINANNAVTDEELSVYPGRWYQLGMSSDRPAGWGAYKAPTNADRNTQITNSGNVIITNDDASVTYDLSEETAYVGDKDPASPLTARDTVAIILDPKRGAIYISPYGALAGAGPHKIEVDYTPAEPTDKRPTFQSGTQSILVAMRYTEQAGQGVQGQDIYVRRMRLSANGQWDAKSRSAEQQLPLTGQVLEPTDGWPAVFGIQSMGPDGY